MGTGAISPLKWEKKPNQKNRRKNDYERKGDKH